MYHQCTGRRTRRRGGGGSVGLGEFNMAASPGHLINIDAAKRDERRVLAPPSRGHMTSCDMDGIYCSHVQRLQFILTDLFMVYLPKSFNVRYTRHACYFQGR